MLPLLHAAPETALWIKPIPCKLGGLALPLTFQLSIVTLADSSWFATWPAFDGLKLFAKRAGGTDKVTQTKLHAALGYCMLDREDFGSSPQAGPAVVLFGKELNLTRDVSDSTWLKCRVRTGPYRLYVLDDSATPEMSGTRQELFTLATLHFKHTELTQHLPKPDEQALRSLLGLASSVKIPAELLP